MQGGKWQKETLLTKPNPSPTFSQLNLTHLLPTFSLNLNLALGGNTNCTLSNYLILILDLLNEATPHMGCALPKPLLTKTLTRFPN